MVSEVKWLLKTEEPLSIEEEEREEKNYLFLQTKWQKDRF